MNMPGRTLRWVLLTAIGFTALPAVDSEAGPILDWLRGRRLFRRTVVGYAPAPGRTVAYAPSVVPQQQVVVNYAPQTTLNYAPQTTYRTQWQRVPTTRYEPVITNDPATGYPVTYMKPCTTWSWQALRIPYTTWRPVVAAVAPVQATVPAQAVQTVPVVPQPGYQVAPPATQQAFPAIPQVSPNQPVPATTAPGAGAPASTRPSLKPVTPAQPHAAYSPPSPAPSPVPATTQRSATPPATAAPGSPATVTPAPGSARSSWIVPGRDYQSVLQNPPSSNHPDSPRPIPDPDAASVAPSSNPAPRIRVPKLLRPRTASARAIQHVSFEPSVPARWSEPADVAPLAVKSESRQEPVKNTDPLWDESGWRPAR